MKKSKVIFLCWLNIAFASIIFGAVRYYNIYVVNSKSNCNFAEVTETTKATGHTV